MLMQNVHVQVIRPPVSIAVGPTSRMPERILTIVGYRTFGFGGQGLQRFTAVGCCCGIGKFFLFHGVSSFEMIRYCGEEVPEGLDYIECMLDRGRCMFLA